MNFPSMTPAPERLHRKRNPVATTTIAPTAPVLIAATYIDNAFLDLSFDQAIDISAFDGSGVVVDDAVDALLTFIAIGGAMLLSPTTARIELVEFENATGTGVTLTAGATTNIVALNGGGTWNGVNGLALPFG